MLSRPRPESAQDRVRLPRRTSDSDAMFLAYPCNDLTRRSPSNLSRIASAAARAPAAVV